MTKGVDPIGKKEWKATFTPDPAKLKALIDYIRSNHLDSPPSPPAAVPVPARPGDGTCILHVDSRGRGYTLPCADPLPNMIRDIVPASLTKESKSPARPALVPPVTVGDGMPDYATVSLKLDTDFRYEVTRFRESIKGPDLRPRKEAKGPLVL